MLLQDEELLLTLRHPDYRPLSLNCDHKLFPHPESVHLCVSGHVCVCVFVEVTEAKALQT